MHPETALRFWQDYLQISKGQFQKVIVTKQRGVGTYRNKTKHGVLTIQVHNKKLRDIIINQIEKNKKK